DVDHRIYSILWDKFSQPIRMLLDNQYTYQGYWDYQNKKIALEVKLKSSLSDLKKLEKNSADLGIIDYYLVSKNFSETGRTIFPMFI
ncbi:MAG: hypothetical protein Q8M94_15670, partial [Ignavibacteria bacterium]|nr:hypothetical protein [Ignavibacteria bacterium]